MNKTNTANLFLIITAAAVLGLFYFFVKTNTPTTPQSPPYQGGEGEVGAEGLKPLTKPIISSSDPYLGPIDAPYTIVNFSDFRCPFCATVARDLRDLTQKFPNKIRLIWKDFAFLPPAQASQQLHEAARCAGAQGKFWQYHDWLFDNINLAAVPTEQLINQAKTFQLNVNQFKTCLESGQMKTLVQNNFEEGRRLGVDGTPYLFLNGEKAENVEEIISKLK